MLLRIALDEPGGIENRDYETCVSSALIEVECLRTLDRLRLKQQLNEAKLVERREAIFRLLEACELIDPSPPILRRAAEPFPVSLGTLDAIHLATALAWQEERESGLVMATHDNALGQAARSVGFRVTGL